MSNELRDLFNVEVDEFQKKAKSEEEIQKMCTKDDLTELQRATFLLKKGYEIQKLSVINNLDRYLKEIGANEELLSLIISSLEDWDDKMQIECAQSFIEPLKQNLLSKDNKQRILKLSVELVTNLSNENEVLRQKWTDVYDHIVGQVDIEYVQLVAFKAIQQLTDRKSTFGQRKLGNRLLTSLAKSFGETAFEYDNKILKLVMSICGDVNYKIRLDGAIFLKEYLHKNFEKLIGSARLKQTFLPDMCELLNDEETYIRIEAIEGIQYVLESLDGVLIERELMPNLLKMMVIENNHELIIQRIAQIIGKVVYKLQKTNLHNKYKEQFMSFFQGICNHKSDEVRLSAAYNLPCFHALYQKRDLSTASTATTRDSNNDEESKEEEGDFGLIPFDFYNTYYSFANDSQDKIRVIIAGCLHEAFKLQSDNEDTQFLRDTLHDLLADECTDVLVTVCQNLDVIIDKYANTSAVQNFNPADVAEIELKPTPAPPKIQLQITKPTTDKQSKDLGQSRMNGPKKTRTTSLNIPDNSQTQDDEFPQLGNYYYLPEYPAEQIYSLLLSRLINYKMLLSSKIALWRECVLLWEKLSTQVNKFHLPEIQDRLVGLLFDDIQKGNSQLRKVCCNLLVKILSNQQDSQRRQILTLQIKQELADSNSFQMRKTFILFCKEAVGNLPKLYFEENFYGNYLKLGTDKVSNVRLDFTKSLIQVKPYIDSKQYINHELSDCISKLKHDSNHDVAEATENTEFELLKQRKQTDVMLAEKEIQCVQLQKKLDVREIKDAEERKKRIEEEEESRYDYGSYGQNNRLGAGNSRKTRINIKGSTTTQITKTTSTTTRKTIGSATNSTTDKTPTKRKLGTQKSGVPDVKEPVIDNKTRKQSVLLPASGNNSIDKTNNTLKVPVSKDTDFSGGVDNYKRYQQLVQGQNGSSTVQAGYKRSLSLLESSKPKIVKKELGVSSMMQKDPSKRKTNIKATQNNSSSGISSDSSDEVTPTNRPKGPTISTTTANIGGLKNKQF